MLALARIPFLGTAEEEVRFLEWLVEPGGDVRRGKALAVVETLKATFEVEADCDGVLLRALVEEGERVPAQAVIGVVGPPGADVDESWLAARLEETEDAENAAAQGRGRVPPQHRHGSAAPPAAPVASAARRRARELGVELCEVAGGGKDGLVRVVDVEAHARTRGGDEPEVERGRLDPTFVAELRRDRGAFAELSSELKLAVYRRMGAAIGDGATLAPGAVLVCERLVLGPDAYVGAGSTVEVLDLEAGALWHLGARARVRCRRARFGDNAFLADDVEIGGGGALDPEAELVVGSHGFVGEHVHLNPCRRLALGDEVVVSRGVSVMTHSYGGSLLRGYPYRFAGVTIGDGAQLGIGAVLFPGVEVGAGAILLSGSSLVSSIPPGRLFGGVPAVDLKAAAVALTPEEIAERASELVRELARQLLLRGRAVAVREDNAELAVDVTEGGRTHALRLSEGEPSATARPALAEDVRVRVAWPAAEWDALADESDVCAIDLGGPLAGGGGDEPRSPAIRGPAGPLADALREFLRKRGVRLRPRAWTYRGGWL